MFNRRRTGEIQRITTSNFLKGIAAEPSIEVSGELSPLEKLMLDKLKRIEIIGKKGRGVPVLLRSSHVQAINLLLQYRPVGIPETNDFLFARVCADAKTPMDACKEVRELAAAAGLLSPERVRFTLLRKHIATVSQLVSLTDIELRQLATFMGHDLNVHMDYYRLPDDVLQITKVGRLLIAAEEGKFSRGDHMNLSDISIDEVDIDGTHNHNSSVTTDSGSIEPERASTSSSMQTAIQNQTNSDSKPIKHRRQCKKKN